MELKTKLNRELQKEILVALASAFPQSIEDEDFQRISKMADIETIAANIIYLEMHGLIEQRMRKISTENGVQFALLPHLWEITHDGHDFIAEDGGLSAILGVVMIKLHDETIRDLIVHRILEANPPDKHKLIDAIRGLPAESIRHLSMKLLDKGLENWPAALAAIGTFCS